MSPKPAACRICLALDVRLVALQGSLQTAYERISNSTLHSADGRPVAACYVCCAELTKCLKLMLTSARAEQVLDDIISKYSEITEASVSLVDRSHVLGLCGKLSVTVTECFETIFTATTGDEIKLEAEDADSTEEEGRLQASPGEGPPSGRNDLDHILDHFSADPNSSTPRCGAMLKALQWKLWETLNTDGQHPYHYRKTQDLLTRDLAPRVQFCLWYVHEVMVATNILSSTNN